MPRINKQKIRKKFTKNTYRKALPFLLEDFGGRCAYSLRHYRIQGPLEVDHFNPHLNSKVRNRYANLMPSIRHCNGKKTNTWPSEAQLRKQIRFLNPCVEDDYDVQIFEDPLTHQLVGTTPAGKFHIRQLDLNAPFLVEERRFRSELHKLLKKGVVRYKGDFSPACLFECDKAFRGIEEMCDLFIPAIKPPP